MRDESTTTAALALQFLELALVQVLPLLAVLAVLARGQDTRSLFFRTNLALALARLGVLGGTRRAYGAVSPAFWLSAFADAPAVLRLIGGAFARDATWRGRPLVRNGAVA
jgi:hypothetical protein